MVAIILTAMLAAPSPASQLPVALATAHHAVTTKSGAAQALFDRGLTLYYAYNGTEAVRVFARAAALDHKLAMAYWGQALGYSADINVPLSEARFNEAHQAIERAASLESLAGSQEAEYIQAMRKRYSGPWSDVKRAEAAYRQAMARLVRKHPSDDDAAALYVEALLEDTPATWIAGTNRPQPRGRALEMTRLLDAVVARNPHHIMANHLIIHIFDSSSDHRTSLAAAARFDAMTFAPEDEHLAHMPAHAWIEAGQYAKAVASTNRAIALFDAYLRAPGIDPAHGSYIKHDLLVGYGAASMAGNIAAAARFAKRLDSTSMRALYLAALAARDGRWADLLRLEANREVKEVPYLRDLALGQIAARAGDSAAAESHFAAAQRAEEAAYRNEFLPPIPTAEVVGAYYLQRAECRKAYRVYVHGAARWINDPRIYLGMAEVLEKLGRPAQARRAMAVYRANWMGNTGEVSHETRVAPASIPLGRPRGSARAKRSNPMTAIPSTGVHTQPNQTP